MANIFIIADTHFGHEGTAHLFKKEDGTPLRPFSSAAEQDEILVENWNKLVRSQDKIYHLGDVAMKKEHLSILERLNGHKRLVRGNHDIYAIKLYLKYFDEIYGVRVFDRVILSHIPIHEESIKQRWWANVHGHLHAGVLDSPRYYNACVEHHGYKPIALEDIYQDLRERKIENGNSTRREEIRP